MMVFSFSPKGDLKSVPVTRTLNHIVHIIRGHKWVTSDAVGASPTRCSVESHVRMRDRGDKKSLIYEK